MGNRQGSAPTHSTQSETQVPAARHPGLEIGPGALPVLVVAERAGEMAAAELEDILRLCPAEHLGNEWIGGQGPMRASMFV